MTREGSREAALDQGCALRSTSRSRVVDEAVHQVWMAVSLDNRRAITQRADLRERRIEESHVARISDRAFDDEVAVAVASGELDRRIRAQDDVQSMGGRGRADRELDEGGDSRVFSAQSVARTPARLALDETIGEQKLHGDLRRAELRVRGHREVGEARAVAALGEREDQIERDRGRNDA